ncbi:MAG TPA: LapA family protein [Novosphingobium sp.]
MQLVRTVVWVLVLVALLLFSLNNWEPVNVRIWEGLLLETKLPMLVLASFLLGLVPMWLLHKAGRWRLNRRINALENTVKATATAPLPPLATSSQLESHDDPHHAERSPS